MSVKIHVDPGEVFYDRAGSDDEMKTLLGTKESGKARVYPGFPTDTLDKSDYPRVTFFLPVPDDIDGGWSEVQVQVDIWVWPSGDSGGPERLKAVDDRLKQLFHGPNGVVQFFHDDGTRESRIASRIVGSQDYPTGPESPLRRRRLIRFAVS